MRLVLLICLVAAAFSAEMYHGYSFEQYMQQFHRRYTSAELHFRRSVFEANLNKIRSVNSNTGSSWSAAVNNYTDMTAQEFRQHIAGYSMAMRKATPRLSASSSVSKVADLPASVDWRTKKVVTGPKDQGGCGSCWAFAATETIESHWAIKTGQLVKMSEQNVLDCTENPRHCGGTGGCGGAIPELAYEAMVTKGIASEETYPYQSGGGQNFKCRFDPVKTPSVANVTGHVKLESNKMQPLMEAVATMGPIAVSVAATKWQFYSNGIFDCGGDWDINHAVQLVGYGPDYWLVRNSWGLLWGENGYIRLKRTAQEDSNCGTDNHPGDGSACDGDPPTAHVCGTCGILYDTSYPTVA